MTDETRATDETTPDSLMAHFQGRGLVPILIFTLVVHVVLIVGSSFGYLKRSIFGASAEMSKEERMESAVKDATKAIGSIAKDYGLNAQELSSRFAGPSRAPKAVEMDEPDAAEPMDEPVREKSNYETNLETRAKGPEMPGTGDEEDIF